MTQHLQYQIVNGIKYYSLEEADQYQDYPETGFAQANKVEEFFFCYKKELSNSEIQNKVSFPIWLNCLLYKLMRINEVLISAGISLPFGAISTSNSSKIKCFL